MRLVTFRDSPHSTRVGILENEQVHGLAAETMIEWLRGEGRVRTGSVHPLQNVASARARADAAVVPRLLHL